jgi:hypothetical protein
LPTTVRKVTVSLPAELAAYIEARRHADTDESRSDRLAEPTVAATLAELDLRPAARRRRLATDVPGRVSRLW